MSYKVCLVWVFSLTLMCLILATQLTWAAIVSSGYERIVFSVMALAIVVFAIWGTIWKVRELQRYEKK